MAVRWPGGSVTGSLLREPVAATPTEPEPETTSDESDEPKGESGKKEVKSLGDR